MKKHQLILLHFAGGNSHSFNFMLPYLQDFEIIPLELPGRGRRIGEELLKDFDLAALDIYKQVIGKLNSSKFIIYGHSMGAYLALKVASLLEKANKAPSYIFVSGNAGPGLENKTTRYLLGREDFIVELKKLGGIPDEVFEYEDMLDFFLPVLRADFEISERNKAEVDTLISSPIYAMMGDQETKVEHITNWKNFTKSHFGYKIFEGGHFFIHKDYQEVARLIKDKSRLVL
ncbi:thioesterase II family protein [Pedobacter cryoconitis]|uniref:Surfactin synthase thioesterase subunit n=1 Tax=Pedobacter cryoconitis TaxID=188932 RepID=A0A7X0J0K0_9SPHI|nr:alpha/beta fold hydrolase [Pedobacter cryoconitis]MBB6498880.1 surfactin synthase thioesterase subunit [Pedobacter cryoconitis]